MQNNTTATIVNNLFDRLMAINPAWKQAWPTEDEFKSTKKEWVLAFVDANINSIEQLKSGLKKLRLSPSPFIPSPGEFIALCKPEPDDIGAPPIDIAYDEACRKSHRAYGDDKKWSHVVVEHARNRCGAFWLSNNSRSVTYPVFKNHYQNAIKDFLSDKIMSQLESKKTHQEYQEYVGRLKCDINLGLETSGTEILTYEQWLAA